MPGEPCEAREHCGQRERAGDAERTGRRRTRRGATRTERGRRRGAGTQRGGSVRACEKNEKGTYVAARRAALLARGERRRRGRRRLLQRGFLRLLRRGSRRLLRLGRRDQHGEEGEEGGGASHSADPKLSRAQLACNGRRRVSIEAASLLAPPVPLGAGLHGAPCAQPGYRRYHAYRLAYSPPAGFSLQPSLVTVRNVRRRWSRHKASAHTPQSPVLPTAAPWSSSTRSASTGTRRSRCTCIRTANRSSTSSAAASSSRSSRTRTTRRFCAGTTT